MLGVAWAALVLLSTVYSVASGQSGEFMTVVYSGAESAVELCLTLAGIMMLWGGFMEIAERSGITALFSKILSPVIGLLFPKIRSDEAKRSISMNITANILGLGNAATPLGIEAVRRLDSENHHTGIASDSMVTFVVINTASGGLVPVTAAALRAKYGSEDAMGILLPVLLTSLSALAVGLTADRLLRKSVRHGC